MSTNPITTALQNQRLGVAVQAALPADGVVPEWIEIMPPGTVHGIDGRGPWTLREAAPVITASMVPGRPVPVDYNHQTVFAVVNGSPSPAAGWIDQMEARGGSIWAHVDWTEAGRQAVAAKDYRYISPTFHYDKAGQVKTIVSVALTNNPNIAELPAIAAQMGKETSSMDKFMTALRQALGLADDANEDAILQACRGGAVATAAVAPLATDLGLAAGATPTDIVAAAKLKLAAGAPDPAKFVPMAAFAELQRTVAKLTTDQVKGAAEAAVADATRAGKLTPAMKDWALAYAAKDPGAFATWAAAAPVVVTPGGVAMPSGEPPHAHAVADAAALAVCSQLGITPAAYAEFVKTEAKNDGTRR